MRISDWSSDVCSSDLKRRWALRSDDDGLIFSTSGSPRNIERPRKAAQRFTQWRFGNVEADYGLGQRLARRRSEATILNRTGSVIVTPVRNRSFLPRELRLQHLKIDLLNLRHLGFRRSVFRMALLARLKRQHQSNVHRDREAKGDTLASVHVTTPSPPPLPPSQRVSVQDRKSTRLNSSH